MWNEPTKEELDKLPRLYETEGVPIGDKIVFAALLHWRL